MTFDDTNNEFTDDFAGTDAPICPWCNERPVGQWNGGYGKTCGNESCAKKQGRATARKNHHQRKNGEYPQGICPYCKTRPIAKRLNATYCGDADCRKAKRREFDRERSKSDERRQYARDRYRWDDVHDKLLAHHRERYQNDDVKAKKLAYCKQDHVKTRKNERSRNKYHADESYREKRLQATKTPEYRAYLAEYRKRPEVIEASRARSRRPDVVEKRKLRGKPFPRGYGGPARRWDMQGRQCAYGWSEFDGRPYRSIRDCLDIDHLVPVSLLGKIGITDKSIVNTVENLWVITKEMNRGIDGKCAKPLHVWLEMIGEPKPVVDMGRAWYESVVGIIIAKQQAIDPTYELTEDRRKILGLTA